MIAQRRSTTPKTHEDCMGVIMEVQAKKKANLNLYAYHFSHHLFKFNFYLLFVILIKKIQNIIVSKNLHDVLFFCIRIYFNINRKNC